MGAQCGYYLTGIVAGIRNRREFRRLLKTFYFRHRYLLESEQKKNLKS